MTLPCSRQSDPGSLLRTLPYSRRPWTPASAFRSARPSRSLPGTHTRGLRVCTPTSTAALTSTRFGDTGDAFMVSPNTTCSSFISEHPFKLCRPPSASCSAADHDGRTWVSVARSLRRFSRRRHHRDRRVAPRTLDSCARDVEDDALSISSGCSLEATQVLDSTEVKAEPSQEPAVPPTLLCKEEVSATNPVSCSSDPVPDFTDPPAGPGLLDGFSFLFTETDNFGCPVVTGDELSPLSDTIPHTVPDSFSDTLEGIHVDSLLTAETDSLQISDLDVPCPGQPVLVHRFLGVSRSLADSSGNPVPPAVPQFHFDPASTPHCDGNPIPTPPAPRWSLKVALDQDTRRLPLLCSGTPTFHDVITGVCILFNLAPFEPAARPILFYRDSDGDTCTLTNTTYHDALPLFSATRIIRLSLAATHLAVACPSTLSPDAVPPCPGHLPSHASRYLPPAHAVASLSRDQLFLRHCHRKEHDHAIAQWKSQHRDNPCSTSALHSLRENFPTDSTGGLAVLRTCLPQHTPDSRNQALSVLGSKEPSTTSISPPPRQCPVPGAWSADEVLSAAKWIFGSPGLVWSPTPGAGGHKQIRIKFAVINHWNSGVVNVQGRDAHLVSEKLLSTRQLSAHHSPVPDSGWLPNSRRRKRFSPSPDSRISSTDCRSPPAPPPFTPSPQRIPPDLSRFSALSSHDLDLPDPAPLPFSSPPQPLDASPLRRSIITQTVPPLSSGSPTRTHSPTRSSTLDRGSVAGSWFFYFYLSLSGVRVLAQLCHSAGSVFDLFACFRDMSLCQEIKNRRSLPVSGVLQSTGSQKSIGHRPPVRPLWKRTASLHGLRYSALNHFVFGLSWLLRCFQLFPVLSSQPVQELFG